MYWFITQNMATIHVNNSKLQFRLKLILEDLFVTFLDQYLSISYKNIEKIRLANEFILDFEVQMGDVLEELSEEDLDGNEHNEEARREDEHDIFKITHYTEHHCWASVGQQPWQHDHQ